MGWVFAILAEGLRRAKMELAEDKLVLISTDMDVARAIARRQPMLAQALVRATRNLGADYGAGRNITAAVRRKRIMTVKKRAIKIKGLSSTGANCCKLVSMGAIPAGTYGMA
eukprot:6552536-Heterocapsa_arctica.AAC.1